MIDSHAHMAFDGYGSDREAVITRAKEQLLGWIEIGTTVEESRQAVELAHKYNVWATAGVHPSDIGSLNESGWQQLETLLQQPQVVAVGEVGLDFYRGGSLQEQEDVLRQFITLAQKYDKPVVFHVRDGKDMNAHEEMIRILASYEDSVRPRGVLHTFSGTREQMKQYLDMGMYISFSGVITFKNAAEIAETAKETPLDRVLIETDAPFLTPEPYRGQRNEPAYVRYVAEKLAELRGVTVEEIDRVTEENTRRLFSIAV
ncbi:MAG: TatD family hydrolase [Candidatus Andersenbacteria bacterium]